MYKSFGRELLLVVFKAFIVVATILLLIGIFTYLYSYEELISDGSCNVAVFPVEGIILPYIGIYDAPLITTPSDVSEFLESAKSDSTIQAVLLEINSPGGTPVASERIAESLRASDLPVVGLIGDQGASGGYMIAAATDFLIASAMSDIGSIGVTMSYLEESEKLDEEGIEYVQLTTGKFKDAGSPYRPITEEERDLFQKDLDIVHDHFVDLIARYRNIPREDVDAVADGSTMTGQRALESKLIDAVGGRHEATEALAVLLDIEPKDVLYCEYEPSLLLF